MPTAELTLDGAPATLVGAPSDGVRTITPMLSDHAHVERGLRGRRRCAAGSRSRGDYARRRMAFGAPLADKPLHVDTLAGIEAEYAGAFCSRSAASQLLGALEHGGTTSRRERLRACARRRSRS